jgi:imidazolonepropionase-like amidohydrolase
MSATCKWLGVVAFGVLAASAARELVSAQTIGRTFLITNVRVFDGERARPNMNVVVEDGIIRSVDRSVVNQRPLATIDGSGATLLPGLIDAHTHPRTVSDLQAALRFGVTTVLDMASDGNESTLRAAATSRVDVADLRSAGIAATSPNGHGTEFGRTIPTVPNPEAADAFVEARKASGSDYLKIILNGVRTANSGMPNMTPEAAKALVRAAHARHMLVLAHIENLDDVKTVLAGGVDGLAHVWREGGADPEIIRRVVQQRVFVVPTLAVTDAFVPGSAAALAADPRFEPFLLGPVKERLLRPPSSPPAIASTGTPLNNINSRMRVVGALYTAGARLLAGTDAPGSNASTILGISLHRELELLVKSGPTPSQALAAATATVADTFHLTDRGRIVAGRKADLLLVRGDPTIDITATRDIVHIWRSGVEFDRRVEQR